MIQGSRVWCGPRRMPPGPVPKRRLSLGRVVILTILEYSASIISLYISLPFLSLCTADNPTSSFSFDCSQQKVSQGPSTSLEQIGAVISQMILRTGNSKILSWGTYLSLYLHKRFMLWYNVLKYCIGLILRTSTNQTEYDSKKFSFYDRDQGR